MKPGIPWNINGIEPKLQDAAQAAARRSGLTLSDWLNSILEEQTGVSAQADAPSLRGSQGGSIQERMDELSAQLNALARAEQDTANSYRDPRPPQAQAEALETIIARVSAHERRTRDDLDHVTRQLDGINRKLDQATLAQRLPQKAEDVPGFRALDQALRKVVDHIEKSERRHQDTVRGLQDRIAALVQDAQRRPAAELSESLMPALQRAEVQIGDLARRVDRIEGSNQVPELVALVEEHFSKLAARIEDVSASAGLAAEVPMLRADVSAVRNMLMGLRNEMAPVSELHAAVAAMRPLSDRVADLEQRAHNAESSHHEMTTLKGAVLHVSERLEQIRHYEEEQQRLRQEFSALAGHVAALGNGTQFAALEQQIAALAQRVSEQGDGGIAQRQIADIESRLDTLTQTLSAVLSHPQAFDNGLADALREQIARTEARLAGVESQLQHFSIIEQAITTLQAGLGEIRSDIHVLRDASPASYSAGESSAELEAMRAALAALQSQADSADQNNRQTLAAVHETLAHIVRKLSDLEQGLAPAVEEDGEAPPVASPDMGSFTATPLLPEDPPALQRPAVEDYIAAARNAALAAAITGEAEKAKPAGKSRQAGKTAATRTTGGKRRLLVGAGLVVLMAAAASGLFLIGGNEPASVIPASAPQAEAPAATPAAPAKTEGQSSAAAQSTPVIPADVTPEALRKAAEGGDPAALFVIANRMLSGTGMSSDAARAMPLLEKAAETLAPAQYRLGTLFESGEGVTKDLAQAKAWYQRAAEAGNVKAMHNLAVLLTKSLPGSEPDYTSAAQWFGKAAQHGVQDSMFNLAVLNERGLGVPANPAEAWFWYSALAKLGDQEAAAKADSLKKTIAAADLKAVSERIKAFTPDAPDRAANQISVPASWDSAPAAGPAQTDSIDKAPLTANQIAAAQFMLKRLGLYTGAADGRVTNSFADAVRVFQLNNGLPVNGTLTGDVLSKLKAVTKS